jgi:hypothetical protein
MTMNDLATLRAARDRQMIDDERKLAAFEDLLAALKKIVAMDESFNGKHQYAAIARAAIAKALG